MEEQICLSLLSPKHVDREKGQKEGDLQKERTHAVRKSTKLLHPNSKT